MSTTRTQTAPAAPASPPIKPQYKRVTWTLKVENSDLKLTDFKGWVEVAASFTAPVTIPGTTEYPPKAVELDLDEHIPDGFRIVAINLTLDPSTPKDLKPLHIYTAKDDTDSSEPGLQSQFPTPYRELGMDQARSSVGYFLAAYGQSPPEDGTLYIINENQYDLKILLGVAYGPDPDYEPAASVAAD